MSLNSLRSPFNILYTKSSCNYNSNSNSNNIRHHRRNPYLLLLEKNVQPRSSFSISFENGWVSTKALSGHQSRSSSSSVGCCGGISSSDYCWELEDGMRRYKGRRSKRGQKNNGYAVEREKRPMALSESIDQDAGALQCHTFDVVVIGAGIIGLSTARQFLLQSDLSVAVVDASVPLRSGATGAGQGYIWMTHRTPGTDIWDLAVRSRHLWQMLIDDLQNEGIDPLDALGWKKSGSLLIGRTKEEACLLKERVQKLHAAGLMAEYLSSSDLMVEEPELEVGPESCAAFLPNDGQIDVHHTVSFLEKGNKLFTSENRYRDFYDDPAVCLLRSRTTGKVEAVQTNNCIIYAKRAIVVAAGCWTGSLMSKFTTELDSLVTVPVQPRKGFLLTLENLTSFKLNHAVMEAGYINHHKTATETNAPVSGEAHLDQSLSISMTATLDAAGNLLVGSSRQFVGFNTEVDMHIIDQIWERNQEFFPALRKFSIQHLTQHSKVKVGLRPYMPDGKPVIGPIPSMPNVFLATGHEGAGLTLALGTAEMIADMVLGNPFKVDPNPFSAQGRCS